MKDDGISKMFIKVLDKNKEFNIVLKRFYHKDNDDELFTTTYYFQPSFVLNSLGDKIIRKDILWERDDAIGDRTEGFLVATQKDFNNYCKKCFEEFRISLCINPFSIMQEPEYTEKEICDLEFHMY